jgi:hypothetical protein
MQSKQRRIMKLRAFISATLIIGLATIGPAAMASDSTPPPGPKDITWAQLTELQKTFSPTVAMPGPTNLRLAGVGCSIDMGNIYFRASGNIYDNGTIGLKPLLKCATAMPFISLSTTMYKKVWYGLQFQVGPVVTSGSFVSQVQTKNIEQKCASRRATTTFVAISRSDLIFPNGSPGGGSAYQEASLDCLTN